LNGKILSRLRDGRSLNKRNLDQKMAKLSTCSNDESKAACKLVAEPVGKSCYQAGRELWFKFAQPQEKQMDMLRLLKAKKAFSVACDALPVFMTEWAECLGKFKSCYPEKAKTKCAECGAEFQKNFQKAAADILVRLGKEKILLDEHMKAQDYAKSRFAVRDLKLTTDVVFSMAEEGGFTVEKEGFSEIVASATVYVPTIKAELLKILESKRCPKGKKRNKGREAKFKKIVQAFMTNDWPHDKASIKSLRMDGAIIRSVVGRTKREVYPTVVCYEKGAVVEAPRCRVHHISLARTKPLGSRWSAWKVNGIRSGGDLLCKYAKR